MIISNSNAKIINSKEVYLHDDTLFSLCFERNNKELTLKLGKYPTYAKAYTVTFKDVLGYYMTSCDYWGISESILHFEYVPDEEMVLLPELKNKWADIPHRQTPDKMDIDYIEVLFTFKSGDQLRIVCKTIEITD